MISLLIFSSCAGVALVLGTILHHRREMIRISLRAGLDTDDYRKGLRAGLMQARQIVGGLSYITDSERTVTQNAIMGAAMTLDAPK